MHSVKAKGLFSVLFMIICVAFFVCVCMCHAGYSLVMVNWFQ